MKAITVRSLDLKHRCAMATPGIGDEQLFAHFSRVQQIFQSLARDQDIDLNVKHRTRAR